MAEAVGGAPSTVYRTVAELVNAGLLEPAADSHYRLGAAFIEFDRLTRLTDPLMRHGQDVLAEIVAQVPVPCVGLLARLYNGGVMCIADAASARVDFRSSYERGLPMPLTSGATGKVILAHLPARRVRALLGGGADAALAAALAEIRRRGFAVTAGEIDAGLVGIAAPVVVAEDGTVASLSLVVRAADLGPGGERSLVLMLVSAASLLTDTLGRRQPGG
jgi:DNA-binding IclR family transcriptional regulator